MRRLRSVLTSTSAILVACSLLAMSCSYELVEFTFDVADIPVTAQSSRVYDRNGRLITELRGEQNRTDVTRIDLVPELVRNAVVAIEDERFYEHDGIDLRSILRAARSNVSSGGISQGASTITQQFIGNIFLDRSERSAGRKIEEIFLALRFEQSLTKDFILLQYLNLVYFGNGAYGIEAAAREYFGAPACQANESVTRAVNRNCLKISELTLAQAALLAGLIQQPRTFNPYRYPDKALKRRDLVLDRMLVNDFINAAEHEAALAEPLQMVENVPIVEEQYPAAFFVEDVKQWFLGNPVFGPDRESRTRLLFEGGLDIHTTIDLQLQAKSEAAVEAILPDNGANPDAAAVTMGVGGDSEGHILAMVGGRDFFGDDPDAKFNLSSGKGRQAGSAMKPIALAAALQQGRLVTDSYEAPDEIEIDRRDVCGPVVWKVRGGRGSTPEEPVELSLVRATRGSINTIYAQLMLDIRPPSFVRMAESLGIGVDRIAEVCAAVLGTEDVNMVEMATVFSTFARSGLRVDPVMVTRIRRPDGTSLYDHVSSAAPVIERSVADQITWVLSGVISRGTGTAAQFGRPAAGKTGTAQNFADAAFIGYTPQRTTAVWVGFPEAQIPMVPPTTDIRVFGGTYPARIWREIMVAAHEDIESADFPTPPVSAPPTTTVPPSPDAVEIPDLIGRIWDPEVLAAELEELSLQVQPVEVATDEFEAGTIVNQAPLPGSLQPGGITITVEVAVLPELPTMISVASVIGLSDAQARQVLAAEGLGVTTIFEPNPLEIDPGYVWQQNPLPGTTIEVGGSATIWVQP